MLRKKNKKNKKKQKKSSAVFMALYFSSCQWTSGKINIQRKSIHGSWWHKSYNLINGSQLKPSMCSSLLIALENKTRSQVSFPSWPESSTLPCDYICWFTWDPNDLTCMHQPIREYRGFILLANTITIKEIEIWDQQSQRKVVVFFFFF